MHGLTQDADASALPVLSRPHENGCLRRFSSLRAYLAADLHRYAGKATPAAFLRHVLFTPGYAYTFWMRSCGFLKVQWWGKPLLLYYFAKAVLLHLRYKYGIAIPEYTVIGPGLFINRFGGVMINGDAVIGANCNITHGAMLGQSNRGKRAGSPIVGDRVFLAAGCKVIGKVRLGDDCAIGANAVVTRDVPPMGVAVGAPARIVSMEGSRGYINRQASLKGVARPHAHAARAASAP